MPNLTLRFCINSLNCIRLNLPDSSDGKNSGEVPKTEQSNVSKAVPTPLPQMRRSTFDEIENPEGKEKKESKSKTKRKADKELENGSYGG